VFEVVEAQVAIENHLVQLLVIQLVL
jgi:hypothetical protein